MKHIIIETTPLNILEEKTKFLASETYNPQFIYAREFQAAELIIWGVPQDSYFQHAQKMLNQYQQPKDTSPIVTQSEIETAITDFNERYKLKTPIELVFSDTLVTRCRVTGHTIYFQLPLRYTLNKFTDLLRHELETHALRRINHHTQPWSELEVSEAAIRETEEGIAGLHTFLFREYKIITKSYLTYTAVYTAQQGSFRDVYNAMIKHGTSQHIAWQIALRTKRGLTDTTQPGGLTKDLTYFEGSVKVWDWLINQKNDPRDLYLGRLSLALIAEYKSKSQLAALRYPSFFEDLGEYLRNITAIGDCNEFDLLL